MTGKRLRMVNGDVVDDCWRCPECGYTWEGHDRAPPYPHCPKCEDVTLRRCR